MSIHSGHVHVQVKIATDQLFNMQLFDAKIAQDSRSFEVGNGNLTAKASLQS